MNVDYKVDLLVLGMGAAAELAAIYAHDANPDLNILIATKALKGKGGCSRMVQGGFNVVLDPGDSHEKHLMDTLKGGQYINPATGGTGHAHGQGTGNHQRLLL